MAKIDYSKYSDEDLERLASGKNIQSNDNEEESSLLGSLGKGYMNYAGGAIKGIGQGLGDLGASVANYPISGLEKLTGLNIPHVPHPHLTNDNPDSFGESLGQAVGQVGSGFLLPGGAALKGVQLANRAYRGLNAGKELPIIGKLLAGSGGGALEGAAANEENRPLGAAIGGVIGAGAQGANSAINLFKNIKSSNIAKHVSSTLDDLGNKYGERFNMHLQSGGRAGADEFIKPQTSANISLLKKVGEGKLAYGLEKFNNHPTLENAHMAQSDLNKIAAKYSRSREGTLEHDVYKEALKYKNRILQNISEAFEKSGVGHHGEAYDLTRKGYATDVAPYLRSPTISGYLGKNKRGTQTVRPSQFADKLLQEEDFLAQAGHNHPGLLQREIAKSVVKHPLTKVGAIAGAAFLPYEIRKLLKDLR